MTTLTHTNKWAFTLTLSLVACLLTPAGLRADTREDRARKIREWLERARQNGDQSKGGRTKTSSPKRIPTRAPRKYFIDSVGGSDKNNGRSKSSPWQSHTKAETASL